VEHWFEDYGIAAIIISRPVPMLTEILSCLAGLSRVNVSSFTVASIAGTLPICIIYAYVGHLYGLEGLESKEGIVPMIWVTIAIPAAGWLFTHWVKKLRARHATEETSDA
jgi:membrane protein DedA with SNARE-associated domain